MEFFAGANTRFGFRSLFDEIFKSTERIFILKGSSGCGKSTFMKRIAREATERNIGFDLIRCSADPGSLDGIMIPSLHLAVADGTAPHLMDVKYPCVRESIINLGQFWEEKELLPYRTEIMGLTDLKSCHYKNAYRALSAAGVVDSLFDEILTDCIDVKRLDSFAFKFAERTFGRIGEQKKVFATAFTSRGEAAANLLKKVKTLYTVSGKAGRFFMSALRQIATEKGFEAVIGLNWCDPKYTDLIYIPEKDALITSLTVSPCEICEKTHSVTTARFVRDSRLNSVKNRLKGLEKLKKRLLEEAKAELSDAKETHDEIEEIYIPAMDFDAMDKFTDSFLKNIFGE